WQLRGSLGVKVAGRGGDSLMDPAEKAGPQGSGVAKRRQKSERGSHIGRPGGPAKIWVAVAPVYKRCQNRLDQIRDRVPDVGDKPHRIQQRQVLGRNHVVSGGGGSLRRQYNRRINLRRRETFIARVHSYHARKGVEVGEDIDRVLREVGPAVVFEGVN